MKLGFPMFLSKQYFTLKSGLLLLMFFLHVYQVAKPKRTRWFFFSVSASPWFHCDWFCQMHQLFVVLEGSNGERTKPIITWYTFWYSSPSTIVTLYPIWPCWYKISQTTVAYPGTVVLPLASSFIIKHSFIATWDGTLSCLRGENYWLVCYWNADCNL